MLVDSTEGITSSEDKLLNFENSVVHGPALEGTGISEAKSVAGRPRFRSWKLLRFTRGRRTR